MKSIISSLLFLSVFTGAFAQGSCDNALPITLGTYPSAPLTGQFQGLECNGTNLVGGAAWYSFTSSVDMAIAVSSSIQPVQDTRLFIFSGACGSLQCEGFDDDGGEGFSSALNIAVSAGVTYFIVWDNFWETPSFSFSISETTIAPSLIQFNIQPSQINAQAGSDFDGDHLDDLLEISGDQINVALQQPDGTFNIVSFTADNILHYPTWSLTTGDLNNDGIQDIVCGGGDGVSILMSSTQSNTFSEYVSPIYIFSQRGNCVEFNNDGNLDVFMCHDIAPNVRFTNNGNGTFSYLQGGLGDTPDGGNYGSVWIDYDNDCDKDLFIAKCRGGFSDASRNELHRNNGDGTFTDVSIESGLADYVQTWSSSWGDYDNDGDMDVVVGASSFATGHHKVMRNNGDGTFSDVTAGSGWDLFMGLSIEYQPADFNNNGLVDVIGGGNYIAVNNGNFNFTIAPTAVGAGCLGDFNNDGFIDVATGSTLFLNEGNENNYIKIATVGTESNLDGIGARITLYAADGNQIRDIRSGEGFRFMSTNTAHFGLGTQTAVSKIEICWPSGIMDEILNPDINTTIVAIEGENAVSVEEDTTDSINIFPNPVEDILTVQTANNSSLVRYEIFDINGRVTLGQTLLNNQVNVSGLSTGIYTIKVISDSNVVSRKFYKK